MFGVVAPVLAGGILGGAGFAIRSCTQPLEDASLEFNEAKFRISQVDELNRKVLTSINWAKAGDDSAMQKAFSDVPLMKVAALLGGVTSMPLGNDAMVWIGGSGYQVHHLPRKRGFQNSDFADVTLQETWRQYYKKTCGRLPPDQTIASVEEAIEEYRGIASTDKDVHDLPDNMLTYMQWRNERTVKDVEDRRKSVAAWVDAVAKSWDEVASHEALAPFRLSAPSSNGCA